MNVGEARGPQQPRESFYRQPDLNGYHRQADQYSKDTDNIAHVQSTRSQYPASQPSTTSHRETSDRDNIDDANGSRHDHTILSQPSTSTMTSTAGPIPTYTPYQWNSTLPAWSASNTTSRADAGGLTFSATAAASAGMNGTSYDDHSSRTNSWSLPHMYSTHPVENGVPGYAMTALYGGSMATSHVGGGAPWATAPHRPLRGLVNEEGRQHDNAPYWPSWPSVTTSGPSHSLYSPYHQPVPGPSTTSAVEAQARWAQHEHRPASWNGPVMTSSFNSNGHDHSWDASRHFHSNGTSEGSSAVEDGHRRASSLSAVLGAGNAESSSNDSPEPSRENGGPKVGKKKALTTKDGVARKPRKKKGEAPKDWAQRKYVCEICSDVDEPVAFSRPSALRTHQLVHTKEREHVCDVCARAFSIMSNLTRHQKLYATKAERALKTEGPAGVLRVEEEHRKLRTGNEAYSSASTSAHSLPMHLPDFGNDEFDDGNARSHSL